jgi:hypothetical protein
MFTRRPVQIGFVLLPILNLAAIAANNPSIQDLLAKEREVASVQFDYTYADLLNGAPVMAPAPALPAAEQRPMPAPLLTPGLSGTWGSGSGQVNGAANLKTAPPATPTQVMPHGEAQ